MEQDAEHNQDINPATANIETGEKPPEARDVIVEATDYELQALDALGPDSELVKMWMSTHGISENDRIIANGNVYTARASDFLTRDEAATEQWAANAARSIVAIENEIDARTEIIAEEEPRITTAQAEAIGEEGLDAAGVDDPGEEPSPWSAEGTKKRIAKSHGIENPIMLDIEDVQISTTVTIDGRDVRATTIGYYFDDKGDKQMILGPMSADDAALFEGKTITKPMTEIVTPQAVASRSEGINAQLEKNRQESDRNTAPVEVDDDTFGNAISIEELRRIRAMSPDATASDLETLSREEYLSKITEGLSDTDKKGLESFADNVMMQEGASRRGEYDNVAKWKRDNEAVFRTLSPAAQAAAHRYAQAKYHY